MLDKIRLHAAGKLELPLPHAGLRLQLTGAPLQPKAMHAGRVELPLEEITAARAVDFRPLAAGSTDDELGSLGWSRVWVPVGTLLVVAFPWRNRGRARARGARSAPA